MSSGFAAGAVVRLGVVWKYNGVGDIVNVIHAILGPNVASTDAAVLADLGLYVRAAYANITEAMCDILVHDRIEVKNVTTGAVWGSLAADANLDGDWSDDCVSPDTTSLVVFRTLISRVLGRVYLPPMGEGWYTNGVMQPAELVNLTDFADYLMDTQNMVNGTDVTYGVHRATGTTIVPNGYRVIAASRKQARRQLGRGS